jgi:hypothetical protein
MSAARTGLVLLAIPACGLAQAVRAIRYPAVAPAAIVSLTRPSLTIASGDCEFNRVNGLVMQANGGIVVANGGEQQLCYYDSRGSFVAKAGRRGQGPGEFSYIDDVSLYRADSILVGDRMQRRISILGPAGQPGRQFPVKTPDTLGSYNATRALTNGDVLLAFMEVKTMAPSPKAITFHQQFFRASPAGEIGGRIARLVESEHFVQAVPATMGGTAYWTLHWGKSTSLSPLADGFVAGDGGDNVVTGYDRDGHARVRHVVPLTRRSVTPEMIAQYRQESIEATKPPQRPLEQKRVDEMPYPAETPAYNAIIADQTGPIWVQSYPDSSGSYWLRLDPATATTRAFRFPARFRLYAVRSDRACGVGRDEDDLQTVYCFSVPR